MPHDTSDERWVPIEGYEGMYEVSDLGQVRSLDRVVPDRYRGQRRLRGRVLRQSRESRGRSSGHAQRA